jgi:hypothetical protein
MIRLHQIWLVAHKDGCRLDEMIFQRVQQMKRDSRHRQYPRTSFSRPYFIFRCNDADCPAEVAVPASEVAHIFCLDKSGAAKALHDGAGQLPLIKAIIGSCMAVSEAKWRPM